MDIQWYPGHMAKTRRQITEKLKLISVAVIAVDARAPKSTLSPDLVSLLSGKACVIALNKSDLADSWQTKLWLNYYRNSFGFAVSFSATRDKAGKLIDVINKAAAPVKDRYAKKGMRKSVRVLVAGVPNVGKSAIINRLIGRKSAKEGNIPGVTRALQWVRLSDDIELMDSPGLLWPKIESREAAERIAVLGGIKHEITDGIALARSLINMLADAAPHAIARRYEIEPSGTADEVLNAICQKRGFLIKRGEIDTERGARMLLDEFRGGRLGRITLERV